MVIKTKKKRQTSNCCLSFGEGILLWGIVKLYNVLGGFYSHYNSKTKKLSVHNVVKNLYIFLCNYDKVIKSDKRVLYYTY